MTLEQDVHKCPRCERNVDGRRLFCSCGKLLDLAGLKRVRLAGMVGVGVNPKFDDFWASGDPADLP